MPRLLTEKCIGSFLDHFTDRKDYNLRWIFHLDQYPVPGLEMNWEENMRQAVAMSGLFDTALLMGNQTNQSYGGSVYRVMREVNHPVLWIEDDKLWKCGFSLAVIRKKVKDAGADSYCFSHQIAPGTTAPTFHEQGVIDKMLSNYPEPHWSICEKDLLRVAKDKISMICMEQSELGEQLSLRKYQNSYWHDAGARELKKLGVHRCHPAIRNREHERDAIRNRKKNEEHKEDDR